MKYILLVGDGMADRPHPDLGGKTPLEFVAPKNLSWLAQHGQTGMIRTIPKGIAPGSDTGMLSVLGCDPQRYYSGRSPLEAAALGIKLSADDMTLRCNLITLSQHPDPSQRTILSHSAGGVSDEQAFALLQFLTRHAEFQAQLQDADMELIQGTSYRHLAWWRHAARRLPITTVPPHDILGKPISSHLPADPVLQALIMLAQRLLENHPVNQERVSQGMPPVNGIWFWGEGTAPNLPRIQDRFGLDGAAISAVPLVRGISLLCGLSLVDVPGANGELDTNYEGKAQAAIAALENKDFVLVHVEAPDECGHDGDAAAKAESIRRFDQRLVSPLLHALREQNIDFRLLMLSDHATPLILRTHTDEPVPYCLYDSTKELHGHAASYDEPSMAKGDLQDPGYAMLAKLFETGSHEGLLWMGDL